MADNSLESLCYASPPHNLSEFQACPVWFPGATINEGAVYFLSCNTDFTFREMLHVLITCLPPNLHTVRKTKHFLQQCLSNESKVKQKAA